MLVSAISICRVDVVPASPLEGACGTSVHGNWKFVPPVVAEFPISRERLLLPFAAITSHYKAWRHWNFKMYNLVIR